MPIVELVITMDPPLPWLIIAGAAALAVCQTPVRSTSMTACHSSRLNSHALRYKPPMPALALTMSMCPNSAGPPRRRHRGSPDP
jgi:hypothetical protein